MGLYLLFVYLVYGGFEGFFGPFFIGLSEIIELGRGNLETIMGINFLQHKQSRNSVFQCRFWIAYPQSWRFFHLFFHYFFSGLISGLRVLFEMLGEICDMIFVCLKVSPFFSIWANLCFAA